MNKAYVTLLLLSVLLFSTHAAPLKKKVCIVGAGPAGIVSVKHLADHLDEFEPIAFERNSDVGGLWIYDDSTTEDKHGLPVHSSAYKYLRTSQPKELMSCPDYPKFEGEERSCVRHDTVVDYMKNYTEHFDLRRYVKFDTNVEKVTPVPAKEKWQHASWDVETRDLNTNKTETTRCFSVIVCTGLFLSPNFGKVPGIDKFPGRKLHSHVYRKPEEFANQTVLILGAKFAGPEIAFDLSPHVKTIYLSHRRDKLQGELPSNVIQVPGVVKADGRDLILSNGSRLQADSFIFCTGYKNELRFLDASSGIEVEPKYLHPLYNQVINVNNPTMGFVGLVREWGAFCPKFYSQANYYVSFLQNKFQLPSREIMLKDANWFTPENLGDVKDDWYWNNYVKQLADSGAFEPPPAYYGQGSTQWAEFRKSNLLHCKEYNLRLENNSTRICIKPALGSNETTYTTKCNECVDYSNVTTVSQLR